MDRSPVSCAPQMVFFNKEGHLFLTNDSNKLGDQLSGILPISIDDRREWVKYLSNLIHLSINSSFKVLILPACDKNAVYWDSIGLGECKRNVLSILNELDSTRVLDPYQSLIEMRSRGFDPYPLVDSHWSTKTCIGIFEQVLSKWGESQIENSSLFFNELLESREISGDLGNKLVPNKKANEFFIKSEFIKKIKIYDNGVPDNGRIRVFINPDGVINGRLLIIGDSYSYNLAEVAACVFKEVVQIGVSDLEDGIIEELHPTHVIFEKAERFFIQKPLMLKNFFEIISKKIQDRGIASVGPIITRFNYYKPLPIHIGINGLISKMQNFLAKEKLIDGPLTFAPDINNHVGDFISLGKSCEYGFIQKFFQSENVGLLKWANVNFENLLRFILAFKDQDRLVEGFQIRPRVLDNGKITYFSHIDELGINFPSFEYFSEELTGDSLDDLSKKYFFRYKFLLRIFNESLIKGSNYVYLYLENQVDSWAENSRRLSSHLLTFNPQNRLIFVNYDAKMKNSVFIEDSESLLICRTCNAWNNEGPSSNIKYYFWADMAVRGHKYFTERATL